MEQWHVVVMFCWIHQCEDTNVQFVRATSRADADVKARPALVKRLIEEGSIDDASEIEIDKFAIVICTGDTEPTYPQ